MKSIVASNMEVHVKSNAEWFKRCSSVRVHLYFPFAPNGPVSDCALVAHKACSFSSEAPAHVGIVVAFVLYPNKPF